MGGTDDPSNLIELTVADHAEAHRLLWEQHGKEEDYYAWKGLASHIGKEEIRLELARLGGRRSGAKNLANMSEESKRKRVETRKNRPEGYNTSEHMHRMYVRSQTAEAREKQKRVFNEIGHQQGSKNSMYGTMWIYNASMKQNKRIKKGDPIDDGWFPGRRFKWD